VPLSPVGSWQLPVGDVADQHVAEGDLDLPSNSRAAHSPQQLLSFQVGEMFV
jgi:hypothetical protein